MSITDAGTIDAMGIDKNTKEVVLTITDHLDWEDQAAHLSALEVKINAYLGFLESGQLVEEMPEAAGRTAKISVYCQFEMPTNVTRVIEQLRQALSSQGIGFYCGSLPSGY